MKRIEHRAIRTLSLAVTLALVACLHPGAESPVITQRVT